MQETSTDTLRRFCLHVVRFMSTVAMDPHLYFEKKLAAEFALIDSPDELRKRLKQLVDWVGTTGLTDSQVQQLDEALTANGLPSFSLMRDSEGEIDG